MAFVSIYKHLRKLDQKKGEFVLFSNVRAIGLAVEVGWKAAKKKGLGNIETADVSHVTVTDTSGKLQVLEDARWRGLKACTLNLRPGDAAFAKLLVEKQRDLLGDMRLNIWDVEVAMKGGPGFFDLVGDFTGKKNYGVTGRVWVELKVFEAAAFSERVDAATDWLEEVLPREARKDPHLGAVLLLAARVESDGGSWRLLNFFATLRLTGGSTWLDVVGRVKRTPRGRSPLKPPLSQVWEQLEWHKTSSGEKVGLYKHFLEALNLKGSQPGARALTHNKLLAQSGHLGRVREEKLDSRSGRRPWVASKDTFRALHAIL